MKTAIIRQKIARSGMHEYRILISVVCAYFTAISGSKFLLIRPMYGSLCPVRFFANTTIQPVFHKWIKNKALAAHRHVKIINTKESSSLFLRIILISYQSSVMLYSFSSFHSCVFIPLSIYIVLFIPECIYQREQVVIIVLRMFNEYIGIQSIYCYYDAHCNYIVRLFIDSIWLADVWVIHQHKIT